MPAAYDALTRQQTQLYRLGHLSAICGWDQAANMPPKGNDARSAALAELAQLTHQIATDPQVDGLMATALSEPLGEDEAANLREIHHRWRRRKALPESLVTQKEIATGRCEHAWRSQRPASDWEGFLENFRPVVALAREEAQRLSQALGVSPYEALVDGFEPGLTEREIDSVFTPLRQWLPGLIAQVMEKQSSEPVIQPQGPFPLEAQRRLCEQVMQRLGFDFSAGRLDVSTHPFCGGVPEDVRLTTRFNPDEFLGSLYGTIHETGHGRYQQNLPTQWQGQPLAQARSMAFHESQSLFFEMQLGAHPGFVAQLSPLLVDAFGPQDAFEPENLQRLLTRVKRGYIRVDSDEVTYPAHILLRTRLERALISGEIEAEDLPSLWDEELEALLGLRCDGEHHQGVMQDIHWPAGLFGYFPCYTLGAMYAAQWFATIEKARPTVHAEIEKGQLEPTLDWLKANIWQQGSRWTGAELAQRASGEMLNPQYFRDHLSRRYLD
ncbi:MAG: hypothetical protein RLY30_570 [Pseudomonadota bacterium]|jgi:carboxypeptidase Taq